ncbi:hypothetical protein CTM97_06030 [Photobacterium phosphoreum]|uniref:Uncharacterized protein n=1 Tax=Photobacterium phosphoreum TaxID=659 RepID=A0A2T3JTN0_PHOPO|nr:hypothetical protein [Photobacterium phosphoreum]PSU25903.1 hypothetical protein CTM96_07245 [Photobacterium phosphoreum]PSU43189.1 hypothetical protein CTM97_06030 [Photobacterium phosphoreum]PSU52546.1 hypothetical protein C9J18_08305 [Photobacterium phosphoreum]
MNRIQRFFISLFLSISIIITEAIILSHMSTGAGIYIGIPLAYALAIIMFIISYFWVFKCIRPILKTFSIIVAIFILQFSVLFFFQPTEGKAPYYLTANVIKTLSKYDDLSIEDLLPSSEQQQMVVSYKFQYFLPGYLVLFYTKENSRHKKAKNNIANLYIHNDNYYFNNKNIHINKTNNTLIINDNIVVDLALLSKIPLTKEPLCLNRVANNNTCSHHNSTLFVSKLRLYNNKTYDIDNISYFFSIKILKTFFSPQEKTQPLQLKRIPKVE